MPPKRGVLCIVEWALVRATPDHKPFASIYYRVQLSWGEASLLGQYVAGTASR